MTEEIRHQANELHSQIDGLEKRITILGDINSSCKSIRIYCEEVGQVLVEAGYYEPALDFIIDELKQAKERLEDAYREL